MENVRNIKIVRPFSYRFGVLCPLLTIFDYVHCPRIHLLADHDRSDSDRRCSKQGDRNEVSGSN